MKSFRYIISAILACAIVMLSACSKEDILSTNEGQEVEVTFLPQLADDITTRAIGDGTKINQLKVVVYEATTNATLTKKFELEELWSKVQTSGVKLTLIEGRTYSILFWAQDSVNNAYSFGDSGNITVNYNDYLDGGFAKMEELDAFCGTSTVGTDKIVNNGYVILTRPLAQLNFADNTTEPVQGTHKAVVTFHSIPTSFNPFTGAVTMTDANDNADDITFTFTNFPGEELSANNTTYHYISCNYLFAPTSGTTSIEATLDLQKTDGTSLKRLEFKGQDAITLEKNKKTNVIGSIVQQPVTWSIWDGTVPTESTLTQDTNGHYIIDEAADIAWLTENGANLTAPSTFVQTINIDMNDIDKSIQLPAGSTYDGGGKTIKNYKNSLFGDATSLSVQNLIVDEITASSTTHVGVLVNTLKGSANFSNVTVTNSSATTNNGAAGGMVGYIVRTTEKDRNEKLNVSFNGCKLNKISVSGSASEGKFVGLLSGYDNNELLSFDDNCEVTDVSVTDYASVYTKANNSAWVTGDVTEKYDGWLGHETYRRAKVTFAGVRMAPRWDGTTKIAPLTDGTTKLIYSAFDLASLQGSGHTAVIFKEDVDLGGDRTTNKNPFTPISTIGTLDGGDKTIYNLYVNVTNWIGAFIGASSGTTSHKNLNFSNSSVLVKPSSGSELAYAATLCAYIEGSYTVENIKIDNAYVLGISKSGGLNGYVTSGTSFYTAKQCSVNNLRLENSYLHLTGETFAASGEMGGLVGFIQQSALVESCSVTNSVINCSNSFLRHVNQFIGTIRLDNSSHRIDINKCNVSGNIYENKKDEKSKFVGGYSLSSLLQRGKVYIDGTRLR